MQLIIAMDAQKEHSAIRWIVLFHSVVLIYEHAITVSLSY